MRKIERQGQRKRGKVGQQRGDGHRGEREREAETSEMEGARVKQ